ncbi:MAG: Stp1/IreP family PP2C-type Ser/Thr phosphatase [Calditrichaeota bacterium]|nr:MAG: Stp1/IreP family PP2C-type Ser/Thr phosphatase [Calditrichota bacterium]
MEETVTQDTIFMAAGTDVGTVRKKNEDSYYFSRKDQFFFLCDGMGGHNSGEVASKLAIETMKHVVSQPLSFSTESVCADVSQNIPKELKALISGVRYANRRILHHAIKHPQMRGMGTTIVAAHYDNGMIYMAHVGDSRIYRLRKGKILLLTSDHSWLNELLEDKEITEKDVKDFNEKNVLTRALGTYPSVKIDVHIENVEEGDLYILCSDGLHNALSDHSIEGLLNSSSHASLQDAVDGLISKAKQIDGSDNITAGLIYVPTTTAKTKAYRFKKIIKDENDAISQQLDKTIKNYYSTTENKSSSIKKWAVPAVIVLSFLCVALYANLRQVPVEIEKPITSSALFTEEPEPGNQAAGDLRPTKIKKAGQLVLLQVRDPKYIDLLRSLKNVKVLDAPKNFKKNIPIHAGMFTWAIADSSDYILYKNDKIRLSSLDNWTTNNNESVSTKRTGQNNGVSYYTKVPVNRGLIYLVGIFQTTKYSESQIFLDDRRIGKLQDNLEDGFAVQPGNYTLTIRSASGQVQHSKRNIEVVNGQILAVEF